MYYFFYAFVWLITWLPLRVLYLFSDFAYLIIYYIVGYRKLEVRNNLLKSFPTKTKSEIRRIERRFYHFFCDLFVETLYEMHCSESEIKKRMKFIHLDSILKEYEKGRSVMLMTAHYGNWEWTSSLSLHLPNDKPLYGIFKRLRNPKFDNFICQLRKRFNGENVEKYDLIRKLVQLKRDGKLAMFGMISDQTPNATSVHYWTRFLNQDTPTLTGTEVLARKFDYPVYFAQITCIKRGYYSCTFIPIALEPKLRAENEITNIYMQLLEKTIQNAPEFWLWTHRRWKIQKE